MLRHDREMSEGSTSREGAHRNINPTLETHLGVQYRILGALPVTLRREQDPKHTPPPANRLSDSTNAETQKRRAPQGGHSLEQETLFGIDRRGGRHRDGGLDLELMGSFAEAALDAVVVDVYVEPIAHERRACQRDRGDGEGLTDILSPSHCIAGWSTGVGAWGWGLSPTTVEPSVAMAGYVGHYWD